MLSRSFNSNFEIDEYSNLKNFGARSERKAERRADRKFNPLKEKKKAEYIQTVSPSHLSVELKGTNSTTTTTSRKPNKITSTKPDLDLLFSLFSVIEENNYNNNNKTLESESEYEQSSYSPQTSPIQMATSFPTIPSQESRMMMMMNNVNNTSYQNFNMYPTVAAAAQYSPQGGSYQNVFPSQETYFYSTTTTTTTTTTLAPSMSPSTTNENLSSYSCDPSSFSNEEEDYYSASFENVNSYHDIMNLLPPIFIDSKNNTERALPFSELVDVFNM